MKHISIKIKFGALVGILIAVVVVTISVILLNQEKKELITRIQRQGILLSKSLASQAAEGLTTSDELLIFQAITDIMKEDGVVEVFILNPEGEVISHNNINEVGQTYDTRIWHSQSKKEGDDFAPRLYIKEESKIYDFLYPIRVKTFKKGKEEEAILGYAHVEFSYEVIQRALNKASLTVFVISLIILILGIGISFLLAGFIVKPIMQIARGAEEIGGGNLEYKIIVKTRDELEILANQFNIMTGKLEEAQNIMLEQERMKYELDIATSIQTSLIPKKIPELPGVSISAYYKPAKEVGGDYYDIFKLDDGRLGIVVADVSGKGVPGAMVMVMVRSILKAQAYSTSTAFQVLVNTNRYIFPDIKRGMFITAFYGILDPNKITLQFANAGHNQLIVYKKDLNKCEVYSEPGIPLGVQETKIFEESLCGKFLNLNKGDIIIQYTDGITEAKNLQEDEYELKRLLDVILKNSQLQTDLLIKEIIDDVNRFCGEAQQYDDIAIIAIRV